MQYLNGTHQWNHGWFLWPLAQEDPCAVETHSHSSHCPSSIEEIAFTIIPSKLVNKAREQGVCSFIFELIQGFLTGRPHVLRNKTLAQPKIAALTPDCTLLHTVHFQIYCKIKHRANYFSGNYSTYCRNKASQQQPSHEWLAATVQK